jgi:hypothetical protein
MPFLASLPVDVLRCIVPLLQKETLAELAQTCQLFYALARPLLFKHVKICLNTFNGRLGRGKLARDLEMLERTYGGQKMGELVQSLSVLSDTAGDRSNNRPWDAISTGFAAGLVEVLRCLPDLRQLIIDGAPSILRPKTPKEKSQYSALAEQLRQASRVSKIEFTALSGSGNRTWWLRILLGSLAENLVQLDLDLDFDYGTESLPVSFASSTSSLPLLVSLRLSGGDYTSIVAAFLDCLLSQCSQLVCLKVVDHLTTLSNFRNIFSRSPTLRTLEFVECNLSEVEDLDQELSRSQLLHFSVLDCRLEIVFWLPHLPSTLVEFCYRQRGEVTWGGQVLPLELVCDKLSACFREPSWCPNLASLDVRIEGDMASGEVIRSEEREQDLREALLRDLRCHRNKLIDPNLEIWIPRECVSP